MSKNLYIGFGIAIFFLTGAFIVSRPSDSPVRNYPPKTGPIIAFGDSLVAGAGATEGHDFVTLLSKQIGRPIDNMGVSGDTTEDALARIDEVTRRGPSIVLVLLGGNDFIKRFPKQTTFNNLRSIIDKLQASGAITIVTGVRDGVIWSDSGEFKKLAEDTESAYVPDILYGLFGDANYMSDEVHPNDDGNAKMAEKVFPVLRKLLR